MALVVQKYWQLVAYLVTLSVGCGITLSAIRQSEARLNRLESTGTMTAQQAARHADDLDRRVTMLEANSSRAQSLLERIDERTGHIVARMDRFERERP